MSDFDQTIAEIERKYPSRKIEETVPQVDKSAGIVSGLNIFAYLTFACSALLVVVGFANTDLFSIAVGVGSIPLGLLLLAASSIVTLLADISAKLGR